MFPTYKGSAVNRYTCIVLEITFTLYLCVRREVIFIEKKNQVSGLMGFNLNLQSAGLCKLLCT